MFNPFKKTVDRNRSFLSSLGMERSQMYMLAGFVLAVFALITILGREPAEDATAAGVVAPAETDAVPHDPKITVGGMQENVGEVPDRESGG